MIRGVCLQRSNTITGFHSLTTLEVDILFVVLVLHEPKEVDDNVLGVR